MVRLLPKVDFGQLIVIPAITYNAVITGPFAGQVIGLCCAGYSGEGRIDGRCLAKRLKTTDCWGVRAYMALGQAYYIKDSGAFHGEGSLGPSGDDRLLAVGLAVTKFVDRIYNDWYVHLVYFKPLA